MLEGRGNSAGWIVVGLAVASLVAFTGLLYVRGGSGPPLKLSAPATPSPATTPSPSPLPASPSGATAGTSASPGASGLASPSGPALPLPTGPVPTASSVAPATPRASPTPGPSGSASPTGSATAYRLPTSPQPATVALENGQGGCPNLSTGGVVVETKFTLSSGGRLTVTSPSNHRLSGRVLADGSFSVTGSDPVERWIGTLTDTGGTGSYFIVAGGCTEGYETTIAFHP